MGHFEGLPPSIFLNNDTQDALFENKVFTILHAVTKWHPYLMDRHFAP